MSILAVHWSTGIFEQAIFSKSFWSVSLEIQDFLKQMIPHLPDIGPLKSIMKEGVAAA